ncbi:MAG: TetR/AcrR family transcriptional regulator [Kordiimonadaceae bacterium]|nr:TetR/AcrR family transcriptional regulator [Kordiimonadaceae bacterium]
MSNLVAKKRNNTKSERSREEILDAAWDLIAIQGASVSMAKIAAAVGMTRQSIYVHFGSRGGLLIALVRRADDRFDIWGGVERAILELDPTKRLDACLRAWYEFVPKIHPVAKDLISLRASDPDAAGAWIDRMEDLRDFHLRLIETIAADGALADGWTIEDAADFVWGISSVQMWDLFIKDRKWSEEKATVMIRKTIATTLLKIR